MSLLFLCVERISKTDCQSEHSSWHFKKKTATIMKVEVVPELVISWHRLVRSSLNFDLQRWMLTRIVEPQDIIKRWSYVTHHTPAFHNSDERQYNPWSSKFDPSQLLSSSLRFLLFPAAGIWHWLFMITRNNRLGHQRTSPPQGVFGDLTHAIIIVLIIRLTRHHRPPPFRGRALSSILWAFIEISADD